MIVFFSHVAFHHSVHKDIESNLLKKSNVACARSLSRDRELRLALHDPSGPLGLSRLQHAVTFPNATFISFLENKIWELSSWRFWFKLTVSFGDEHIQNCNAISAHVTPSNWFLFFYVYLISTQKSFEVSLRNLFSVDLLYAFLLPIIIASKTVHSRLVFFTSIKQVVSGKWRRGKTQRKVRKHAKVREYLSMVSPRTNNDHAQQSTFVYDWSYNRGIVSYVVVWIFVYPDCSITPRAAEQVC